jgi:hypothetical protein
MPAEGRPGPRGIRGRRHVRRGEADPRAPWYGQPQGLGHSRRDS